jgi:isopenicillin-N N-acyltransferase-like protein
MTYPSVTVAGPARERGRQYGEQARDRIGRSIEAYGAVFRELAGLDRDASREYARAYVPAIEAFLPAALEEMAGIAEGAGVPVDDVLALNVRTEVMYAAEARRALGRVPSECSAFAAIAPATAGTSALAGQNWDWLPHAFDTVVVLESRPDDGPPFVTVVEAGLLAKAGVNGHGLAVMTNALCSEYDRGEPGVPYHVLLRALFACPDLATALAVLQAPSRSSSANYLLAHRDGQAVNVEAAPGGFRELSLLFPDDSGLLLHANHFLCGELPGAQLSRVVMPSSPFRLDRLTRLASADRGRLTAASFQRMLADHAGHPRSICGHPDEALAFYDQGATVASLVADLGDGVLYVADGPPCETPFRAIRVPD